MDQQDTVGPKVLLFSYLQLGLARYSLFCCHIIIISQSVHLKPYWNRYASWRRMCSIALLEENYRKMKVIFQMKVLYYGNCFVWGTSYGTSFSNSKDSHSCCKCLYYHVCITSFHSCESESVKKYLKRYFVIHYWSWNVHVSCFQSSEWVLIEWHPGFQDSCL